MPTLLPRTAETCRRHVSANPPKRRPELPIRSNGEDVALLTHLCTPVPSVGTAPSPEDHGKVRKAAKLQRGRSSLWGDSSAERQGKAIGLANVVLFGGLLRITHVFWLRNFGTAWCLATFPWQSLLACAAGIINKAGYCQLLHRSIVHIRERREMNCAVTPWMFR